MIVHLINLDRHADRLRGFTAVNADLREFIRFPAVDGQSLDLPALIRSGIARLLRQLPEDWDIILGGWNFNAALDFELLPGVSPCLVLFEQTSLRNAASRFQQLPVSPQPFRVRQALGIPCYSISPKGARALREFCVPIRPMQLRLPGGRRLRNVGIDCMMAGLYPRIMAFVSFPPLAITRNEPTAKEPPLHAVP